MRTTSPFRHALTGTLATTAVAVGAIGTLTVPASTASAAPMTFPVDTLSDNPADGDTLREAIADANANPGHDTIVFADGLAGTLTMLGGIEMSIVESLDIVGPGSDVVTIDADTGSRVFHSAMAGVDLSISGLTLTNAGSGFPGGAIRMLTGGSFTMDDVTITESNTLAEGGAIALSDLTGDIAITNSHFENNSAGGANGGAVSIDDASNSDVLIEDNTFLNNEVFTGNGGAVVVDASGRRLVVDGTDFTGNDADGDAGALYVDAERAVVRADVTFHENSATGNFGAVQIVTSTDLAFVGATFTDNQAPTGYGGIGSVESAAGDVEITGSQIGNTAAIVGGMMLEAPAGTVEVKNAFIDANAGEFAIGNLAVLEAADFHLFRTTVTNGDSGAGSGPGIWVDDVGATLVERSTIAYNTSTDVAGGGAGLFIDHAVAGTLDVTQSTFSGNATDGSGGAIRALNTSTDISFSTIVGNQAGVHGGAISTNGAQPVAIRNSILADNTAPVGPTVNEMVDMDYSIVTDDPGGLINGANNQIGVDPELGPLADNGGITLTHLPDFGSPAIDAADPGLIWVHDSTDQRGQRRPYGLSDIGSVEIQAPLWIPVTPARVVDTRADGETIDDQYEGDGAFAPTERRTYTIAGRGDIPADAIGVIANVTAVQPAATGYLTVDPCAEPTPLAASLNYTAGVNLGNEVIMGLENGELCVFSFAATQLTIDVVGYIPAESNYNTVPPTRFLDTRDIGETFDDQFEAIGMPGAGNHVQVQIGGRGKVPTQTTVALYVAAVTPSATGYVTIWDCVGAAPLASSLNHVAGVNRGNEVLVKTGPNGEVCIHTSDDVHVTADLVGYIPDFQNWTPLDLPARMLDTRDIGETIDDQFEAVGMTTAGGTLMLDLGGRGDIPADAHTVVVNLTAIQPADVGYVTAHPCGDLPNAASLNYVPGVNGGNEIVASLDDQGRLCLYTSTAVHLSADVTGFTRT